MKVPSLPVGQVRRREPKMSVKRRGCGVIPLARFVYISPSSDWSTSDFVYTY